MSVRILLPLFFLILTSCSSQAQKMDNKTLDKIIRSVSEKIEGQNGSWQFFINDYPIICVTDESHNRMRIIAPIVEEKDLTEEQMKHCMIANFHTALDIKYAISDKVLWSCFIHPLKELSQKQVKDAIQQVYYGVATFGTTYSSTELFFPGSKDADDIESEDNEVEDKTEM